jgi:glycerol-3-phosphate dehydrogenase
VYTSHKDINYQLHKDWPVMADELMHLKRYVDGLVKKAESVKERIREQRAAAASAVKHNKNRKRKTEDDAVVGANVENDVTDNEDGDNSGSSDELTGQQLRAIDLDSPRAKKTKFDDG